MTEKIISFAELSSLPIAHTDTGDFLMSPDNGPQKQFLMKGVITKARAGLFYITIEDKTYTSHKNNQFKVDEVVVCVVEPKLVDGVIKDILIVGLEKITS
jgi:hypothetical protein